MRRDHKEEDIVLAVEKALEEVVSPRLLSVHAFVSQVQYLGTLNLTAFNLLATTSS